MRVLRVSCLLLALLAGTASTVLAEGFALNEWSARGVSLAGGMVGRADDVSAAYNAAGITQLPGTHVMGGLAFIAPLGTIGTEHATGMQYTTTKPSVWLAPHGYASYQLNDNVWLGMGVFSRFGLGNSYSGNWTGRYNLYDVGVQTISFVPTWPTRSTIFFPCPWAWRLSTPACTWATKFPHYPRLILVPDLTTTSNWRARAGAWARIWACTCASTSNGPWAWPTRAR